MLQYISLIKANKNIILTGAPGTGKTYLAQQIASSLGATKENGQCKMVQFHPSYDYTDFVEGLRPIKSDSDINIGFKRVDGVFKAFCKQVIKASLHNGVDNFDESWERLINDIEEKGFIEVATLTGSRNMKIELNEYGTGLTERTYDETGENKIKGASKFFTKEQLRNIYEGRKGVESGGHDSYRRAILNEMKKEYGLMPYKISEENQDDNSKNYVFIIDEINRGEISKIFGELFYSIDSGYRGKDGLVETQYQNLVDDGDIFAKGFYVPQNVYIIGTMNDIDRSVDSMDFAMRRRFAWKEIKATDRIGMLDDLNEFKDIAVKKLINLNNAIENTDGLNTSYHMGPAYFRKAILYKDNPNTMWSNLWEYHIKGVLYEYIRGTEDVDKKMTDLEKAYNIGNE